MYVDWLAIRHSSYWASDVSEESLLVVLDLFIDGGVDTVLCILKNLDKTPLNIRHTHVAGYVKFHITSILCAQKYGHWHHTPE